MTGVPRIALRPGYEISRIIRGGWQLSGDHGAVEAERAVEDIVAFYDAGITTFDCADIYTGVEELYGRGLARLADERGRTAAAAMKIHTKYVPDITTLGSLTRDDTRGIISRSLQRLGRDRLDLVQFHWWDYAAGGCLETVGHLADLQAEGLIDRIGVTNFDRAHTEAISEAVDLVSAQVQYSLMDRRPAGEFSAMAGARHVHIICYGVLAGGFLTDHWLGRPDPGFAFENRSLIKYRLIIEEFGGWDAFQELLSVLGSIADRQGADIAAVAVRAMLDDPAVSAVIVGARYAQHLPRLLKATDVTLTDEDHAAIADIQARAPGPGGDVFELERDRDGRHGSIMKYNLNAGT
jgi:aryl-alcohol dehydrogenase-like predicted oxidoreductase